MKVLLHICCGVCAGSVVSRLRKDGYEVTGYFYNPNIQPREEYEKRLAVMREAARVLSFELIEGEYDPQRWLEEIAGLEKEPEGGKRCFVCYKLRLEKTAQKAKELVNYQFTSTLTVSPHKNAEEINKIGRSINSSFLSYDFKKEDGFKKTMAFAKEHNFYRQNYCGCQFSMDK